MKRTTVKDIAKLAGVSRGTVDRAINNKEGVSEKTRSRILEIAKSVQFKKNVFASSLANNDDLKIAIILPDHERDVFWEAPINGIKQAYTFVGNAGISIDFFYFNTQDIASYNFAIQKAIQTQPSAFIVAPVFFKESLQFFQLATQNDIPVICINTEIDHPDILTFIGQDSFQCGQLAGRLISDSKYQGCITLVITLGSPTSNARHIEDKIAGLRAFNGSNCIEDEIIEITIENYQDPACINDEIKRLSDLSDELKAIFFTNSRAYYFLNRVPEKIFQSRCFSIIGFDPIQANIELLLANKIDILLNQNPVKQGEMALKYLYDYLVMEKVPAAKYYLPSDIILKENYRYYSTINEAQNESYSF